MYDLICMSFDGEYVRDSRHKTVKEAEETSADMGSKWYFYPFHFIVKNKTVIESFGSLVNMKTGEAYLPKLFNRKRLTTVKKVFKGLSDYCEANDIVCDSVEFESLLIDQSPLKTWQESKILNY